MKYADEKNKTEYQDYLKQLQGIRDPSSKSAEDQSKSGTKPGDSTSRSELLHSAPPSIAEVNLPKSSLDLSSLQPATVTLVSGPNLSLNLATIRVGGKAAPSDYKPASAALRPLVTANNENYKVVEAGLKIGAVPYSDRAIKITELSRELERLMLLQTKMGHKAFVDARFSIMLSTQKPCFVFIGHRDETLESTKQMASLHGCKSSPPPI